MLTFEKDAALLEVNEKWASDNVQRTLENSSPMNILQWCFSKKISW